MTPATKELLHDGATPDAAADASPTSIAIDARGVAMAFRRVAMRDERTTAHDVDQRATDVLELCATPSRPLNRLLHSVVLNAALALLGRPVKGMRSTTAETLLRIVLTLQQRMTWTKFTLADAADELVLALTRTRTMQGVAALTVYVTLMNSLETTHGAAGIDAIRLAVDEHMGYRLPVLRSNVSLENILANGSSRSREVVLADYVVSAQETRDDFVQRSAESLVAILSQPDESTRVRDLAFVLIKDAAARNWCCRDALLRVWLDRSHAAMTDDDESAALDLKLERDVLALDGETFVGESLLTALSSSNDDAVKCAAALAAEPQRALLERLVARHGLLNMLAQQLDCSSSASAAVRTRLWSLLQCVATQEPTIERSAAVADSARAVVAMAVELLCSNRASSSIDDQRFAFQALQWPQLERELETVDAELLAALVRLLVREPLEASARDLVAFLRSVAADMAPRLLDELVQRVWDADADTDGHDSTVTPEGPLYMQNLLRLLRDVPDVALGELRGYRRVACATAVAALLRKSCDVEKELATAFFVHELGLNAVDPMHCSAFVGETRAVASIVIENLEDVMFVALKGSVRARRFARCVLTALASHDVASCEKLRVYQTLYRPEPALVAMELLDAVQPDEVDTEAAGDVVYEYSDDDDNDEDGGSDDDGDEDEDSAIDQSVDERAIATRLETVALKELDTSDDWELV